MTSLQTAGQVHSQSLRDLTLSPEAPMAFCVRLLLQQLQWRGRPDELFELISGDPRQMDLVDARNLLLRLGFSSSQQQLRSWTGLNPQLLPALYLAPDNVPWVLSVAKDGSILAGNVHGRAALDDLQPGGRLILPQERSSSERVDLLKQIFYRFTNRIGLLYVISFSLALLALTLPFYIRGIYNLAIPSGSARSMLWLFLGVLFLFGLDWILRQWRATILAQLGGRIDALLGVSLLEKVLGLELRDFERLGRNGLVARQRSLDSLVAYLQGPLAAACLDFPFIIIYIAAIAWIAGWLVLVPLSMLLLSALLVWSLSRFYAGAAEINQTTGIGLAQAQQELVNRFLEIKLANVEWVWLQKLRGLSAQGTSSSRLLNQQVGRLQVVLSTTSQLAAILTLAFGAWMSMNGPSDAMAMGNLIAAMFFVWRIFGPFQQLLNALLRFSTMRNQYQSIDQLFRQRSAKAAASNYQISSIRLRGSLLLESAACRGGVDSTLMLTRVSLAAKPGQIVAITGQPGCGKSTVLQVLDQLYPMTAGTLLVDGKDYRQFTSEAIQKNIAYMMSDFEPLPGTVWRNLTALNADTRQQDVWRVCTSLQLLPIIESFSQGFNTEFTSGLLYELPTGVLKLFALAQAMIKDAPILLLDDPTQGLAPEQFDCFLNVLPGLRRSLLSGYDCTVVIATDNKLVLDKVDALCILDKGVTVFQGTPQELRAHMQRDRAQS